MVTVTRLRLQEAQSVAQLLADAMFQRVFDVTNAGPQDPYQAIQQDDGLKAIINAGLGSAPAVRYVLYADRRRARSQGGRPQHVGAGRHRGPRRSRTSRRLVEGGTLRSARRGLPRAPLRGARADPRRRQAVRRDPGRHLHAAGRRRDQDRPPPRRLDRADRAGPLDLRRHAARAVDAAADPRDPERPEPAGPRRARRRARSARARSSATSAPRSRRSARSSPRCGRRSCRRPPPTSSR